MLPCSIHSVMLSSDTMSVRMSVKEMKNFSRWHASPDTVNHLNAYTSSVRQPPNAASDTPSTGMVHSRSIHASFHE